MSARIFHRLLVHRLLDCICTTGWEIACAPIIDGHLPSSSVFDCPSCKLRLHAVGRPAAYVSALFVAEVRLARWPLMCHDRVDGDEPTLTHDFLAVMRSVRRGGVTPALQNSEGAGHIGSPRGRVIVLRRDQLEAVANRAYDGRQAEYVRLIEGG